jgi:hypothetical protein
MMIHWLTFIRFKSDGSSNEGPGSIGFLPMKAEIRLARKTLFAVTAHRLPLQQHHWLHAREPLGVVGDEIRLSQKDRSDKVLQT